MSRNIDWSHKWTCSGHWRYFYNQEHTVDFEKIGKNRDGDYCERGRTWVSDHVKGPEDAPLIKKTRVIGG
jgi:hypothetical protein